ncbi:MAG: sulfatase-like hydrolase/transferase [Anaerolineae bacterium]
MHNIAILPISRILLPSVVVVGFTALALLLLRRPLKDGGRAGFVVSIFWVLFFSYGHVYPPVVGWVGGGFRHRYLLLVWALLFLGATHVGLRIRDVGRWTRVLNAVALALMAIALVRVGGYELRARRIQRSLSRETPEHARSHVAPQGRDDRPDIYYIVPDRYASASTLKEQFGVDNGPFLDALADRGFYVADESCANYPKTFLSLASSLNMRHLTYLAHELGREASDQTHVYEMLQDHGVWRFLRAQGYSFVHVGSGWEPTRYNRYADENVAMYPAEFPMMLYRTTVLFPLGARLGIFDPREMRRRAILRKFDALAEIPEKEGPKFVFAHFLLPHDPYVFGPRGEILTQQQVEARTEMENYARQLTFTNQKLSWLIDQILEESERPPIIILQSDEGPCQSLEEFGGSCGDAIDWRQLSDGALRAHMRILNAYHLPGVDADEILYPSITPVNTFRVILDHYFGTDHGLVEDKSYIFENPSRPYTFIEITDRVQYD